MLACVRRALSGCLLLALLGVAPALLADSYLDRAAYLMAEAVKANEFLRRHLDDRELARMVEQVADGRLKAAKGMLVPEQVGMAHPHLLLMLEHYERAADSAASGELKRYYKLEHAAQGEEQLFRSILRQLGSGLPEGKS